MFEKSLAEKMKRIFDFDKVTFDQPGESNEQEVLFLLVEASKNSIKDGRAVAKVSGKGRVFANNDKLPFGYFSKRIQKADVSDTKDLFFSDIESNTNNFENVVERSFSFVYFFDSQYDPDLGTLTSIELEAVES